jgi:hypothetical protein
MEWPSYGGQAHTLARTALYEVCPIELRGAVGLPRSLQNHFLSG